MSDLHERNPVGRFVGLSELYARCRPTYPSKAITTILERAELGPTSLAIDVGCGTGISARLLAERGISVIGIEPNDEMRAQAESEARPGLSFRAGSAEATGLDDSVTDLILAAQAFHWFDVEKAFAEFHRVLRPGGHVALMWNERDEDDPFTAAYGDIIRSAPEAKHFESARASAGEPILRCPLFEAGVRLEFPHHQRLDEEGVLGRAFSASYAPRESPAKEEFEADLRGVFARFQSEGVVDLRYATTLFLVRRPK